MKCLLCNRELSSFRALGVHLSFSHKDCAIKAYYDRFLKKPNESVCPTCGNECKFISLSLGYHKYCSKQCTVNSKDVQEKSKVTKFERYAGKYHSDKGLKSISEHNKNNAETRVVKLKETNKEKYGTEWASQNEEIKEKVANTNLANCGNKCSLHGTNQSKTDEAMIVKIGYKNPMKSEIIKQKAIQTKVLRHDETSGGNEDIIEKSQYSFDGKMFESNWELAFYIYHKDKGIQIEAHSNISDCSKYIDYVNETYTKDFLPLFDLRLEFPYPKEKRYPSYDDIIRKYHKSIWEARREDHCSPIEAWQDKELVRKCALNRLKYVNGARLMI